jgi:quercetin dioxygenase-like cupin family protein
MKVHDVPGAAAAAVSNTPDRPAAALLHDHDDGRLLVFRIAAGQQVPVHTSVSSVFLTVIAGAGFVSGAEGERAVVPGNVISYAPNEPHGMRAESEPLVLTALITPRPAAR